MQVVLDWMWPAESPSNDAARGMEDAMEDAACGMETAMEDAARKMEIAIKEALEDAVRGNEIADDCEKRLKTESDVARRRYHCARTDHLEARQRMRMPVGEIDVASAEDRVKKMKAEHEFASTRYHFARRRWKLTEQWKLDMEDLAKQWKEDMQYLALWEHATQDTCPETHQVSCGARDRAWRHTSMGMGGSTSEETLDTVDLPEPWIDAASCVGAAEEDEREGEVHEETPALPTPLPIPPLNVKDEDKQRQQWQMREEALNPMLQKRRKTNEEGGFKIDGRERSNAEMSYNGECATVGCSREKQYEDGCDWDRCCKECFVTDGKSHDAWCDYAAYVKQHVLPSWKPGSSTYNSTYGRHCPQCPEPRSTELSDINWTNATEDDIHRLVESLEEKLITHSWTTPQGPHTS